MTALARAIATVGYAGLLRPAPGTWGSAAALPLAALVWWLGGALALTIACGIAYALGLWATAVCIEGTDDKDPSEIVIDELAGQWIALLPVAWGAERVGASAFDLWPGWVAAFVLFRLFDIWKPGPVGWADRMGGATGVMLDDVVAGLLAALGVVALAALAHLVWLA